MPEIELNGCNHYYEIAGQGQAILFIHGAFVDSTLWDSQWGFFSNRYQVVRYDLRGHGKTGPSGLESYSIKSFADDLKVLIENLGLSTPILCGLSLGGMIAQDYAVRHPQELQALILADTAVSVSLTLSDKLQRYVFFPKWLIRLTIKTMNVEGFTRFSFWLAKKTRSEDWLGRDDDTRNYIYNQMLAMDQREYLKMYDAIYAFKLLPLERIICPTLVLNGEYESASVLRHTAEVLRRVPHAESTIVPGAGHTSNRENAAAFNRLLASFLKTCA
jgi:pimeloyl-ACP methyl ester carboxylesterase